MKAVVSTDAKAEELVLHILPRVLRVSVVVRLARPKSVIVDCIIYKFLDALVANCIPKRLGKHIK